MAMSSLDIDQSALLAFKSYITFDPQNILANNWSTSSSKCNWVGVTCDANFSRVITLTLPNMGLNGTLPPNLGNLSSLVELDLHNNSFHGIVPNELALLSRLENFNLCSNNFGGEFPTWVGELSKVEFLSLCNNSFSGSIPASLSNLEVLESLDLSFNSIEGSIPPELGRLPNLTVLDLAHNRLSSKIPSSIFNISTLQVVDLSNNSLSGNIPQKLGDLSQLRSINLSINKLVGSIPLSLFNMSTLQEIQFTYNNLSGSLPMDLCNGVPMLEMLDLSGNAFSGLFPSNLLQCKHLKYLKIIGNRLNGNLSNEIGRLPMLDVLDLSNNNITGVIPDSIGNLINLQLLGLLGNNLTGDPASSELSFLTALTKCRKLKSLVLSYNPLNGALPSSIGNLSNSLQSFVAWNCNLKGQIPSQIGNLKNVFDINFSNNQLIGQIPSTLGSLLSLQRLDLSGNKLNGSIPGQICQLTNLDEISLEHNNIFGLVPECLGGLTKLRKLYLDNNNLNSIIPSSLWSLSDILEVSLSFNGFSGSLPTDISGMKGVIKLDISNNKLSGDIPSEIGDLQKLLNLSLANNMLQGSIPDSVGSMLSLEYLDLSHNTLSGIIPKSLEKLVYLQFMNLSYNRLEGEIPSGGEFANFTAKSFMMNGALCGRPDLQVPSCPRGAETGKKTRKLVLKLVLPLTLIGALIVFATLIINRRSYSKGSSIVVLPSFQFASRISYYELLAATKSFDDSNLIGKGGIGSVFKGVLSNGMVVAVKVFNMDVQGASRSFDIECEAMRNLRHRNLVKVITSCSNEFDFKALVIEFVPNGSLEKWLYSYNNFIPFLQRLNIMIDVASALDYLHYGNSKPVVHCDLKPSNVLLDEDMVAHVCDFGIAKLLEEGQSQALTNTLATIGYIAPGTEYGSEGIVSIKGDVYSYGVMLMEVFTRKRPTDEMFKDGLSLRSWIKESLLPNEIIHIVDPNLMEEEELFIPPKKVALLSIMELALNCSSDSPAERMSMKEVFDSLNKIRNIFLQMPTKAKVETMDSIGKTLLFFLSLSSLHLLTNGRRPFHIVHHDVRSDILKLCEHTTNPTLCAQTIQPHVLDGDIDPFKALEIEVEATLNETKKAIAIIDELLTKNSINKSLRSSIKTCKEQYNYILDSIKETQDAIAQHDLIEAKFKFSAVISYQSSCMDEFEHFECPFAEGSETIYNLGGNTLDIIADLEKTVPPQELTPPVPSTYSESSSTSINVIGTIS
ncbi:unnamed protein product [Lupinus luteus]|uniref:non-specific serine/threonine protein kinase n=1 Tax=Lupinus luteus TaxID=3873 RepID=A0AAV1VWB3_LUPLU